MADTVKIAVCDDEKNIRLYLISLIRKQDTECGIMEYASAGEYLADSREHDLVFLDIEIGGSGTDMDGMGWQGISGAWRHRNSLSSYSSRAMKNMSLTHMT